MEQRDDAREAGVPPGYPKNRAEALTDGIFAFAMTLLVLSLDVPEGLRDPSDAAIAATLVGQVPALFHYFLAFFILASFWIAHHAQVDRLRQIDRTFLWINIAALMFVALVPFSVSLVGDYPGGTFAVVTFEANLLVIGLLFAAQWGYAAHNRRLVRPGTDIRRGNQRVLVVPAVSAIAILLALAGWTWSTAIYAVIPLVMRALPPGR
ncbi:TMEM175 family protein [Methanoculleus sediminis]|uniref:TMEM175 family protein n=1 Tax=Methanoculleus sediminis TaxID=1550566 RepID=UPI00064F2C8F|nr:TMEM175 family protein [Methanoculleus sediminis]